MPRTHLLVESLSGDPYARVTIKPNSTPTLKPLGAYLRQNLWVDIDHGVEGRSLKSQKLRLPLQPENSKRFDMRGIPKFTDPQVEGNPYTSQVLFGDSVTPGGNVFIHVPTNEARFSFKLMPNGDVELQQGLSSLTLNLKTSGLITLIENVIYQQCLLTAGKLVNKRRISARFIKLFAETEILNQKFGSIVGKTVDLGVRASIQNEGLVWASNFNVSALTNLPLESSIFRALMCIA